MLIRLGATVVGRVIQRCGVSRTKKPGGFPAKNSPTSAATIIGIGEAKELAALTSDTRAVAVVFAKSLKSSIQSLLKQIRGCRIISHRLIRRITNP
ncbi:MAG: hypothetical protein P8M20_00955 [Planctomycetaceae bacterium]|nr:hypothetical protein [Planctomycetaceae bacterium]